MGILVEVLLGRIALATLLAGCQVVFPRNDAVDAPSSSDSVPDAPSAPTCAMQNFSSPLNTVIFEPYMDTGVTTDLTGQTFNVHLINSTVSSYGGFAFVPAPFDFTGGTFSMEIVQLPTPAFGAEVELKLAHDPDVYRIQVTNNLLRMEYEAGGTKHTLLDRTYDLATEPVVRVRHDLAAGMMVFESGDGVTFPTSMPAPVAIPLAGLQLSVNIGTSKALPAPGTGSVDNVLISAVNCPQP